MSFKKPRTVSGVVRSTLPRKIFLPATSRLLWMPFHLLSITLGVWSTHVTLQQELTWLLLLPLSLLLGFNFAGLAFLAHETLHGSIVRHSLTRMIVGGIGFSPFCVSPLLWVAWHNRVHHGNTNIPGDDPDAYPTLEEYKSDRGARLSLDIAAPRAHSIRGVITLLIGFSLQATHMLVVARKRNYLTAAAHRWAILHSLAALAIWVALALLTGPLTFVFAYIIPLAIANSIVMAHIITNHSLSPLVTKNDTLASSLTVTVPSWFNFYTLGFGYHVEHHLFPSVSNRHAPLVREALIQLYPTRYQSMPLSQALWLMFHTPRIYKNESTLIDLDTHEEWRTLGLHTDNTPVQSIAPSPVLPASFDCLPIKADLQQFSHKYDTELNPDSRPPPSHAA